MANMCLTCNGPLNYALDGKLQAHCYSCAQILPAEHSALARVCFFKARALASQTTAFISLAEMLPTESAEFFIRAADACAIAAERLIDLAEHIQRKAASARLERKLR